jgi:hypothetical protein
MTVDRAAAAPPTSRVPTGDVLLDGLFTGAIGALAVAIWFLIVDSIAGRPLFTPALLGSVLLHGAGGAQNVVVAPLEVAAYTAFHFIVFLIAGLAFSWLMTLFERFPVVGFVLLVLFACLQVGFFAMNSVLGVELMGQLKPWSVIVANLLAAACMSLYQWKRHPRIRQTLEHAWDQED